MKIAVLALGLSLASSLASTAMAGQEPAKPTVQVLASKASKDSKTGRFAQEKITACFAAAGYRLHTLKKGGTNLEKLTDVADLTVVVSAHLRQKEGLGSHDISLMAFWTVTGEKAVSLTDLGQAFETGDKKAETTALHAVLDRTGKAALEKLTEARQKTARDGASYRLMFSGIPPRFDIRMAMALKKSCNRVSRQATSANRVTLNVQYKGDLAGIRSVVEGILKERFPDSTYSVTKLGASGLAVSFE